MAKSPKRVRDAGTGRIVRQEEAERRPNETVSEDRADRLKAIEARLDKLEAVIVQGEAVAKQAYSKEQS